MSCVQGGFPFAKKQNKNKSVSRTKSGTGLSRTIWNFTILKAGGHGKP